MKLLHRTLLIFTILLLVPPCLFSQEQQEQEDIITVKPEEPAKQNIREEQQPGKSSQTSQFLLQEGSILISMYGTYGITYPGGEIAGEGASRKIDQGYAIGVQASYLARNNAAITAGIGYTKKPLNVSRSFAGREIDQVYNCEFIELTLGYKRFIQHIYWEAGIFGGLVLGDWKQESTVDGSSSSANIDKSYTRHEAGIYAGTGYIFPISEHVSCEIGVRVSMAVMAAYKHEDSLRTNMAALMLAASYTL